MKNKRGSLMSLVLALTLTVTARAASPSGGIWTINSNGYLGALILSVDGAGNVIGTLSGDPIKGFWNDSSGTLTFYRASNGTTASAPPESSQVFTGQMFACGPQYSPPAQCLAGSFQAFSGTGATATKNVFGWFAIKYQPPYEK